MLGLQALACDYSMHRFSPRQTAGLAVFEIPAEYCPATRRTASSIRQSPHSSRLSWKSNAAVIGMCPGLSNGSCAPFLITASWPEVFCGCACRLDRVVPYSFKCRGLCPSCCGRRMADMAAHLVDRVVPEVPVRQWVPSVPFALRYRLAYDSSLVRDA